MFLMTCSKEYVLYRNSKLSDHKENRIYRWIFLELFFCDCYVESHILKVVKLV